jgi:hypothetical protein
VCSILHNLPLFDRELERRGHRCVRYADDSNIYVCSERAGQRVMESVTRFITQKLSVKVNEAKSAMARGPLYLARTKALSVGLSNAFLHSLGLPTLIDEVRAQPTRIAVYGPVHTMVRTGPYTAVRDVWANTARTTKEDRDPGNTHSRAQHAELSNGPDATGRGHCRRC